MCVPDAQPTEAERELWEQVDVVLKDAKGILDELQAYKGAGQEIREVAGPDPCSHTHRHTHTHCTHTVHTHTHTLYIHTHSFTLMISYWLMEPCCK